jgi:HlyD family secretion protein
VTADLKNLKIDRNRPPEPSPWAARWIIAGVLLFLLLGAGRFAWSRWNAPIEVEVVRVQSLAAGSGANEPDVILQSTGYIIAAHKIQVASKVLGRVAWIGVDKADKVKEGQVIVRLEDDEYRAQLQQARGQLANLQARLEELVNGSRPEEIARAKADLEQGKAELTNARIQLERVQKLVSEGVLSKQALDDAQARYDSMAARVNALDKSYELVRIGPRREQVDAVRGQLEQAKGAVAFYTTQLENTVIKAPVTGTILERAVEKGEFVTTSFVGDRGAKGYVVSLADLNDLEVELDIPQNDFRKLGPRQHGMVTTDAYPDRKYDGMINEISPEANRQKATVQVKVKILRPDDYLRPEMNATVSFIADRKAASPTSGGRPVVIVPQGAVRNGAVFVVVGGKAVRRPVKTGGSHSQGLRVEDGLVGGEDIVANPPQDLKDGDKVKAKSA